MKQIKIISIITLLLSLLFTSVKSEALKEIEIIGNERISNETIIMFSDVNINDDISNNKVNDILKSLYQTNFFENVSVNFNLISLELILLELRFIS